VSNFIDEFDRINTPNESLKDSIIDIIESTLVDAPKGRTISDDAVFQVAERAIVASASLEPDVQYFNAVREVQNFLTLALEGPSANGQMSHTDLLPLGHPSSTAQHDLPVATLRTLTANWVASDPRIKSDEARAIVAAVYASNPYSVDYAFNMVRLQSLAADEVPIDLTLQPLVAFGNPYAGKNSSWHRRMRADRQRRDDEGQFAEMGGGIRFYVRKGSKIYSIVGKVAGIPENDPNGIDIEVTGVKGFKDGVYTVPSSITHTFKAILPEHSVSNLVPMAKNSNVPFVDIKDLQRKDLPTSWFSSKNVPNVAGLTSKATPSRNFETGDGYQVSLYNKPDQKLQKRIEEARQKFGSKVVGQFGTDQLNPDKPVYELVSTKRGQAEVVGYAQDWASVQQLATQEDKDFPDAENEPISGTETKPAAKAEVPEVDMQPEPDPEDIPVEVYEPVDPDANMPEGWVKFDDGTYQSEDGKHLVEFGVGSTGSVVSEFTDPVSEQVTYYTEPITIQDMFSVYDLNASQMMGTPVGVGFSWSDVQDIINSSENDMPVEPWNPDAVDNVEPAFMMFDDFEKFETLQQEVRDAAQFYEEKVNPDADASMYVSARRPDTGKSGDAYRVFHTYMISSPAVGELFDDMFLNPEKYTAAEAAAFIDIMKARSTPNPVKNNNYPAFMRKLTTDGRIKLKELLDNKVVPEGQESRAAEIRANLYNYGGDNGQIPVGPVYEDIYPWPKKRGGGVSSDEGRTTAQEIADQRGQKVPTPEFLVSTVAQNRPTPDQIVMVESLLRNRLLEELIEDGDDPDANYPKFQKEFSGMTFPAVELWISEAKEAPFKPGYVPTGTDKYYTNLGERGATSRQLASIERKIERRPGLLSDDEIADILVRLPDMTEKQVGAEFITPLQPRERDYVQALLAQRLAKGQPIDDIELMDGVVPPENYVPTTNLDGTPIGTPAPTPTPAVAPETPVAEEEDIDAPLPVKYVYPDEITYGLPNDPRVVVDNIAKIISDIIAKDGSYEIIFADGTSKTYEADEAVPVLDQAPELPELTPVDTRENFQFEQSGVWAQTRYDVIDPLVFSIDENTKFSLPDNIGPYIVQAVEAGFPIDQMALPEWYGNKEAIEAAVRRNGGDTDFTLDSYVPASKLSPEQEFSLSHLVSSFNAYLAFAEFDFNEASERIRITRQMIDFVGLASNPENWRMFRDGFVGVANYNGIRPLEIEEGGTGDQEFEDARVAELMKAALKADLAILRSLLSLMQSELADALSERVMTAQGKKLIQGAIKDLSILQPKMSLRNKNLPTPADVNEVFATIRDGLIDAGNVQTYGKLTRPSKEMLERLTELSSYFNEAIGAYRAGAITSKPNLMEYDDNGKPRAPFFSPPAFIGPELEGLREAKTFQEVADFLYSRDIYVFDFETTGLFNPIDPEIKNDPVQMAIVKISNGKIADQMSTFMNPESKIGPWTLANVGDGEGGRINKEFLRKQPTKREAMQMFLDTVPPGAIIAGHNGFMYDMEVLNRTLREAGLPEYEYGGFIDTLGLAKYMMPSWSHETPDAPFKINDYGQQKPSNTLESLVDYFGLSNNGRHEAAADVVSTYEVLKSMIQRGIDGKPVAGPEFDFEASTNKWNQEQYELESEEYKLRMAEYVSKRAVQLFSTQEKDSAAEAAELIKNAINIIRGAVASENQDQNPPSLMAFKEPDEPKKPTKEQEAELLQLIDELELDVSGISPSPTPEGLRIIKASVLQRLDVIIQAYAGTGKTTVLRAIANLISTLYPELRGTYLVYNKHNQIEASQTMASNTDPRTFGSIAYRAKINQDIVGKLDSEEYNQKKDVNAPRAVYRRFAGAVRDIFGFSDIELSNGVKIPALEAARMAVSAVDSFVLSADMEISKKHFFDGDSPFDYEKYKGTSALDGQIDETIFPEKKLLRMAKMIWMDITSPTDETRPQLVVTHDDLIKNLQLSEPNLAEGSESGRKGEYTIHGLKEVPNFILIDEAQDMNPATFDIFQKQKTLHNNGIQLIVVGDSYQQIYGFRKTVDALAEMGRDITLPLTVSFRFGAKIARLANKILTFLGVQTDIKGNPDISTEIMDTDPSVLDFVKAKIDAIIARTNYGVLSIPLLGGAEFKKVAVPIVFRHRHRTLASSLAYLKKVEKDPTTSRPSSMYGPLKPYNTYSEFLAAVAAGDKEADQIQKLLNKIQKGIKNGPLAGRGPTWALETIVDSLRAEVPGFSVPEKDKKTKQIPTVGSLGNGLKYEIIGDNLRIGDSGDGGGRKKFRNVPIGGTWNNGPMLKSEGYSFLKVPSGRFTDQGKAINSYFYDKKIEGSDKLASATQMLEDLVAALSGTDAEIFATNAHGAKGLEYDNVAIWDDFENPDTHAERMKSDEEKGKDTSNVVPKWQEAENVRLAYVALTRAKNVLYPGSLSFYLTIDPKKAIKTPTEGKKSNRPDVSKITTGYRNIVDELIAEKKSLEDKLAEAKQNKKTKLATNLKKKLDEISALIKTEAAKLVKEEEDAARQREIAEELDRAGQGEARDAEAKERERALKQEAARIKKSIADRKKAWPAERKQLLKEIDEDTKSMQELEEKLANPKLSSDEKRSLEADLRFTSFMLESSKSLLELGDELRSTIGETTPQLMSFDGAPGEFNYEAFGQESIANLEKSISEAEDQLELPIEDREDALTNSQINEYIASLNQQIADIKADPDYYRKIDRDNLATAKEALQQLLSGNLDPRLLTYAERWALRSPNSVGSSPVVKNRNMILGLRAKIDELSLRLGESNGEQTVDPMLMAFDAADNISDNEAVTPKPGAPGSDENPVKVDLTEEIKSVNKSNQEVVSTVVASILEAMEKGIIPWKKPWSDEGGFLPTSGATGRVYRGLNLLALMAVGMNREYQGTRWYTKNAISKLGGYVNKREDGKDPGVIITFVSTKKYDKEEQVQVPDPDNPDKTKTETRTVTKKFAKMGLDIVYNEDEIQGVELPAIVRKDPPAISEVEGIVLDSYTDKPPIEYLPQDSAYWSPTEDVIRLPLRNQFNSTEEHLDTLFHELTHSTGHQNRLDRKDLLANYGTHKDVRAREELIAEIGSAILAQMMNVNTSIDNVAAYVQSWATWLKGDPNALHEAASLASKAVEHILGGYWDSVDGMVDLSEETEAKEVQAIDMPQGEITGEDGTSGGLGQGINYRIEGESVILMGNTSKYKDLIKGVGIVPEGKKRPFSFIFHGRNKYWFVTLSGETGLGDRMRILSELKKKLDDTNITPA
jgi:antirestriction protein ArdC/DNA polymerase III epsilon subunit-like protein